MRPGRRSRTSGTSRVGQVDPSSQARRAGAAGSARAAGAARSTEPDQPDQPVQPGLPNRSDRPSGPVRPGRPGRSNLPGRLDLPGSARAGRRDRADGQLPSGPEDRAVRAGRLVPSGSDKPVPSGPCRPRGRATGPRAQRQTAVATRIRSTARLLVSRRCFRMTPTLGRAIGALQGLLAARSATATRPSCSGNKRDKHAGRRVRERARQHGATGSPAGHSVRRPFRAAGS